MDNSPEKALLSSYVIKYLNRDSSAKVDRLLKGDYADSARNPLIVDMMLRCQLLAFFSETGAGEITKELIKYYREKQLYSSLLDAKNMLVISSKEDIVNIGSPLSLKLSKIASILIERGKENILKGHIKSVIASCVLMGRLGKNFENLMTGNIDNSTLDENLSGFIVSTCKECQAEIKKRLEESLPSEERIIENNK